MLYCDLCNYFENAQPSGKKQSKCTCELTGFVFHRKPDEYDMENYPCYNYEVNRKSAVEEEFEIVQVAQKKLA